MKRFIRSNSNFTRNEIDFTVDDHPVLFNILHELADYADYRFNAKIGLGGLLRANGDDDFQNLGVNADSFDLYQGYIAFNVLPSHYYYGRDYEIRAPWAYGIFKQALEQHAHELGREVSIQERISQCPKFEREYVYSYIQDLEDIVVSNGGIMPGKPISRGGQFIIKFQV